jgi:molybdopterin-containing oxidoreductase family iron-sulfur binding subunit
MVGLDTLHAFYNLEQAKCILSLDADFLGKDGHVVRHARDFALHRDISELEMQGDLSEVEDKINRLYVVESGFSVTGAKADHRLRMQSSQIGEFLNLFADNILKQKIDKLPPDSEQLVKAIQQRAELFRKQHENLYRSWQKWLEVLGEDLAQNTGKSVVWVGTRQPPHVHALAYFLNQILENIDADASIQFIPNNTPIQAKEINELADLIKTGRIEQLIILGGNPVYNAPVDLQFATLLQSVPYSLHLSLHLDETSQVATWHAPMNHFLESWGDLRSTDGTVSIQQPLIAPLYGTLSALELLAHITGEQPTKGYDIVRAYWRQIYEGKGDFEKQWRRWLHEGVVHGAEERHKAFVLNWSRLAHSLSTTELHILEDTLELNFMLDTSVCDGRFANNAWLQEMPDPITKLTWDNAALIGTRMAREHQLKNGQWLSLKHLDRTLDIPVFIIPGLADHTIFLPLGYGRSFNGRVATGSGFNTYQLRDSRSQYFSYGVTFHKLPKPAYKLISTQEHGRIGQSLFAGYGSLTEPTLAGIKGTTRDSILRYADLKDYLKNPDIIAKKDPHSTSDHPMRRGRSLWKEPNATGGQQWGLVIDLSRCNGCSACVIACQAENNIAVVGKAQVAIGREMHWLRIDRYFRGDDDNPAIDIQPIACAHCENAPCEGVCPVAATVHSPDGLNDIAYNRCIGTRYCANNCPYKVRRFNFFNYSRQNSEQLPLLEMQRNPDVTVRSRGVIEKCSYCVQRINAAKIAAKRDGDGLIPDGTIVPACVQACPSEAIVFGDINDPNSRVAKLKAIKRNYRIFDELNIQPRTTYLASLRNPNRKLG